MPEVIRPHRLRVRDAATGEWVDIPAIESGAVGEAVQAAKQAAETAEEMARQAEESEEYARAAWIGAEESETNAAASAASAIAYAETAAASAGTAAEASQAAADAKTASQTAAEQAAGYAEAAEDAAQEIAETVADKAVKFELLKSGQATTMASGTDFDTITTPGSWRVPSESVASSCPHSPSGFPGRLYVFQNISTARLIQMYFVNGAAVNIWKRYYNGSQWSTWVRGANYNELENAVAELTTAIGGKAAKYDLLKSTEATVIDTATDFDTLTEAKSWRIGSNAMAQSCEHCPSTVAGRLITIQTSQTARLAQLYIANSGVLNIFRRYYSGSSWSAWVRSANLTELQSVQDTLDAAIDAVEAELSGEIDTLETAMAAADAELANAAALGWGEREIRTEHFREIPYQDGLQNVPRYKVTGDVLVTDGVVAASPMIRCPKHLFVDMDADGRAILYFYAGGEIDFETFFRVYSNSSDADYHQTVNLVDQSYLKSRMIDCPDGEYMRIVRISGGVRLYGWDGVQFGTALCGSLSRPYRNGDEPAETTYDNTYVGSGITIPGNAEAVICPAGGLRYLYGVSGGEKTQLLNATNSRQFYRLPTGYDYFRARVVENVHFAKTEQTTAGYAEDSATESIDQVLPYGAGNFRFHDLRHYVQAVCDTDVTSAQGAGRKTAENARILTEMLWSPAGEVEMYGVAGKTYHAGRIYSGVPYAPLWEHARFVGWHITRHTMLNAAMDTDSIYYDGCGVNDEGERISGPGYGLVCSSMACLAAGYPYPIVNAGFGFNPATQAIYTDTPILGSVMTDRSSHCYIPLAFIHNAEWEEVELAEGMKPTAGETSRFSFVPNNDADLDSKNGNAYKYLSNYRWAASHFDADPYAGFPYDVIKGTVTAGNARPYRGDRSVYTGAMDVRINIKSGSVLYFRPYLYDAETDTLTVDPDGTEQSVAVSGDSVNIPHELLEDDTIYGLSTDVEGPVEFFEYHDIAAVCSELTTGNLTFYRLDGETKTALGPFWYAAINTRHRCMPYDADGDYTTYVNAYQPIGLKAGTSRPTITRVWFRGVFGAYYAADDETGARA